MSRWFFPSPGIVRREDFGTLLTLRGLTGQAVEIGTHRGRFARELMLRWSGSLACVDPWKTLENYPDVVNEGDREQDLMAAREALAEFGGRVAWLRELSGDALNRFDHNSLDFVYVDGNHLHEHVKYDIWQWYMRVKHGGGILAGHDFDGDWIAEVRPAVHHLHVLTGLPVYYMLGDAASWYVVKE